MLIALRPIVPRSVKIIAKTKYVVGK